MRLNFSPARNVRSTTAPLSRFFSFVRTNAPPFPGFTCWNSTMRQTSPSTSMCIPFLNWFVLTVSAIRASLANGDELFRKRRQHLEPAVVDDDQILDPDAAEPAQVDAGLDRDDVAGGQRAAVVRVEVGPLVYLEADTVTEAVPEAPAEARVLDHVPGDAVDLGAVSARDARGKPGELRAEADLVGARELLGQLARRERPRAVRVVAVDRAAGVDDDGRPLLDQPLARLAVRG